MWFLNEIPSKVNATFLVEALDNGYQKTSLQIYVERKVSANVLCEKVQTVIPFPWSANKENGSLKIINDETLMNLEHENFNTVSKLTENDVKIYKTVREIKKESNSTIDYSTIREIWGVYTEEDYGVFVFEILPGGVYQIDYTHKVSIFSKLFLPIKFSNYHALSKPETYFKIWVINSNRLNLQKFLEPVNYENSLNNSNKSLDCYRLKKDYDFSDDVFFNTTNWDSSDDDEGDESEN